LFVVPSRLGLKIATTASYWALITTVKHPNLVGKEAAVIRTLREPNQIRRSRSDSSVYLFYRRLSHRWLCVVVKRVDARRGFIVTAYVTEKVKEGQIVWKK